MTRSEHPAARTCVCEVPRPARLAAPRPVLPTVRARRAQPTRRGYIGAALRAVHARAAVGAHAARTTRTQRGVRPRLARGARRGTGRRGRAARAYAAGRGGVEVVVEGPRAALRARQRV